MKRILTAAAIASLVSSPALAASYNFDVLYSGGGVAALAPGSDDPNTVNLQPGDSFDWTIRSDSSAYWSVLVNGNFFPLMAFATWPSGERIGDFDLNLLLDGTNVVNAIRVRRFQQVRPRGHQHHLAVNGAPVRRNAPTLLAHGDVPRDAGKSSGYEPDGVAADLRGT